jgi:hypothetical protein
LISGDSIVIDDSKIAEAESQFQATQKREQAGNEALQTYEAEGRAIREKTARLRALRLSKEAADVAGRSPAAPKRTSKDNVRSVARGRLRW